MVRVWDPYVRVFHWGLVTSFAVAWFSAEDLRHVHEFAGYTAGGLIAARLVMGIAGSRYARFSQFVRRPTRVIAYASDVVAHRERRYLGHNPLGGLMVLALIILVASVAFTGWLQTTDAYWGIEWVEDLHRRLVNVMIGCVILHLAGVLVASLRHSENLVRAMVTGVKRPPAPGDVI
ncbi:cytochrome b/b6 domain-containing protein [Rhizobium sp. SGZ-381]|uniref:cytochrome b/b6 domain-containing protein n=1 Tax=Rhizobium sp. SGZ-381 TaxID=3342800 RepID=UPI0036713721